MLVNILVNIRNVMMAEITTILGITLLCFSPLLLFQRNTNKATLRYIEEDTEFFNTRYLVSNSKCKIPDYSPFHSQVVQFFQPQKYRDCRKKDLLTYVEKIDNVAILRIRKEAIRSYGRWKSIFCCYSNITRDGNLTHPDDGIKITNCMDFNDSVVLHEDFIVVKCDYTKAKLKLYKNVHAAITVKDEIKTKLKTFKGNVKPFSVMFLGIDSVSRLSFFRNLPKTYRLLMANNWIPLKGYNKIADNTFPNLMAILTGFNNTYAYDTCYPKAVGRLDDCPMIWYDFRKLKYVTGYAEDESWMSTFNFLKKGFLKPPTDYYFRPYILGSERLRTVKRNSLTYCTGPESSGERILNVAKDFAVTFKDHPNFSLFWTNTFSHNDVNGPSGMDNKIREVLEEIIQSDVIKNTFVIFLSDHGMRYGNIRFTSIGWLEERLPFIFISVPRRFKEQFPKEFENFEEKRNQLTTPYDLYMTLQHLLVLSGLNYTIKPSNACPKCKSLFMETTRERSCEDAAIEQHWCTCQGYISKNTENEAVKKAANYIISKVNEITRAKDPKNCLQYKVSKIISASVSQSVGYKNDTYFLASIETKPKAIFESTVLFKDDTFQLRGGISRLDKYDYVSRCVRDAYLKQYCYCDKN